MDMINKRPGLAALVAFIAGLLIGLVVLGWWLFPVQFTGADPAALLPQYQAAFIRNAAELYSFDNNQEKLRSTLSGWGGDALACELAQESIDGGDRARLVAAATIVNGQGCTGLAASGDTTTAGTAAVPGVAATVATGQEAADTGGSNLLPLLLLGLLLFLLLLAILYVWNRRRALLEGGEAAQPEYGQAAPVAKSTRPSMAGSGAAATAAPATVALAAEPMAVPIARFRTAFTRGHDTYDDAFSIENANGDFLGECGVGISETIGATAPKNVTAFEVWLFDKNDIRTITKVIMSDHAFFDDALKAKLAPKGEPVLARESETIVLETATLIINAEITEMDYGASADLPDASYFERFTIELSAWAKEGDAAAAKPGEGEDLLRY
jgi:LPXTG-motif cell wall-anchored protein